jgi:hypothetical protein
MFRDKVAYPVYLTIGNVRKDVRRKPSRRAQMLVAYIPITKFEGIRTKTGRRRALSNLFHTCMQHLLAPIGPVGETGTRYDERGWDLASLPSHLCHFCG